MACNHYQPNNRGGSEETVDNGHSIIRREAIRVSAGLNLEPYVFLRRWSVYNPAADWSKTHLLVSFWNAEGPKDRSDSINWLSFEEIVYINALMFKLNQLIQST